MMTLFKIARITTGKHKDDNFVDLAGYAASAAELGPVNLFDEEEDNCVTEVEEETEEAFCESDLLEIEKLKYDRKLLKHKEKIEGLENEIKSLEYGNSQLFKSWEVGNVTIKRMSEELKQEKEFSKMYKSELEHSKEDIKTLKARIHTLYNERDYLKGENEYLKAENKRLSQDI